MTTSSDIIKLDVECVPVILPGWINRDVDHKKADVHLDVTRGLPYADNQDLYILSEHFIEHIPSSRLATLFSESHRISALGGIVRVPIPNLGDIMDAYIKQDFGLCSKLWKITSACRIPTEALCNWGYQFLLNRSKSIRVLNNGELGDVRWRPYRESEIFELTDIEARHFHNQLFVEARV